MCNTLSRRLRTSWLFMLIPYNSGQSGMRFYVNGMDRFDPELNEKKIRA